MEHRITDFSGGFTDYPVDAKPNQMARLDNMLIDRDGKPYVRPGSVAYNTDNPQNPLGATKIGSMVKWKTSDELLTQVGTSALYGLTDSGSWTLYDGITGNDALVYNTSNYPAYFIKTRDHVYYTHYNWGAVGKNRVDSNYSYTAGLPPYAGNASISKTAGANSYVYQFYWTYAYSIDGVSYRDNGPVWTYALSNTETISPTYPVQFSNLDSVSNGTTFNWDTSNVLFKLKIYRTEAGGTVAKYVGEIANGTTTFDDDVLDADLGDSIYINGGVPDNDIPPRCKFLALTTNNIMWYANLKEYANLPLFNLTLTKQFRIRQSVPNDLDSCPGSYYVDLDDDITAINNINIYPIAFTENSTKRLEGFFTESGSGSISVKDVSNSIGCISHAAVVKIRGGLIFPARDGFYFTDGFKIQPISKNITKTYKSLLPSDPQLNFWGKYDEQNDRVYWSINNEKFIVLDASKGVSEESCFTTWSSGQSITGNFTPTSIEFDSDGNLVRGDTRGYVFKHTDGTLSDPEVDTGTSYGSWDTVTVDYDIITPSVSFGSEYTQKYCTHLVTTFTDATQTYIKPYSINDVAIENIDDTPYEFVPIKEISYTISDSSRIKTVKRRFPKKTMRCTHKAIRYRPADQVIAKSDDHNDATVSASGKTILLNNPGGYVWPTDTAGLKIYISTPSLTDDYQQYRYGYSITARSDDTLTLSDPDSTLEDLANAKWELRGPSDASQFKLLTIGMVYHPYGDGLSTEYQSGGDGGNS